MVIIDGSVAGVLASVMVRMGGKDQEVNDRLTAAKNWMREQRIPKAQAARALEYFRLVYRSKVMYEEGDILNTMPPAMKIEFSTQLYEKFLRNIPLFRGLPSSLVHSLCGVVEPMLAVQHQVIYCEDSSGKEMYMLLEGELEITSHGERLGFLSDGAFFGETPILDDSAQAEVRRRTVTAMVDCKLGFIHKDAVHKIADKYPELALRLKRCSRTEVRVNKKSKKFVETMAAAHKSPVYKTSVSAALSKAFGLPAVAPPEDAPAPMTSAISAPASFQLGGTDSTVSTAGRSSASVETLASDMNEKFAEHTTMLRSMMETQAKLLAAVEQLQQRA